MPKRAKHRPGLEEFGAPLGGLFDTVRGDCGVQPVSTARYREFLSSSMRDLQIFVCLKQFGEAACVQSAWVLR